MKKLYSSLGGIILAITANAQVSYIQVNDESISKSEFEKIYAQNIEIEGREAAINTYIESTLLNQKALEQQVDTTRYFKTIYNQVIEGIVTPFLEDPELKNELVTTAWERQQTDKKVKLHAVPVLNWYNSTETQKAEALIEKMHKEMCTKKGKIKATSSDNAYQDLPASWVRGLDLPIEIENAAYNTSVGNCSPISRATDSYFFVQIEDERPSTGKSIVSHIFADTEQEIQIAYKALQEGMKFEDAIEKYSKDVTTKYKNGLLPELGTNIDPNFFAALQKIEPQSYTNPVKSEKGWHILYLHRVDFCDKLEKCEEDLTKKIMTSDRVDLFTNHLKKVAKEKIDYQVNEAYLSELFKRIPQDFFQSEKTLDWKDDKTILETPTNQYTAQNLANELNLAKKALGPNTQLNLFLADFKSKFIEQLLYNTYTQNLAFYNTEFSTQDNLLKRALRVNYVIEDIYQKADADTVGKEKYLKEHPENFTWPQRADIEIYKIYNRDLTQKIKKELEKGTSSKEILTKFAGTDPQKRPYVHLTKGKLDQNHIDLPHGVKFKKGVQSLEDKNNQPILVRVNEVIAPTMMTVDEAGDLLKDAYRNHMYLNQLKEWKATAKIQVNTL